MNKLLYISGGGRNEYLDSLKFYLICFVVLGHTLAEHIHGSPFIDGLLYWIYTFHMPLFVLLSGFFSKKMDKGKFKWFVIRTFETFLIFQAISVLLKYLTGETITLQLIISPISVYWYLFSLILWRSLLQLMPEKWLRKEPVIIGVTFMVGLVAGFIPVSNEFAIQRTLAFLPFFFLGYYSKQNGWLDILRGSSIKWVLVILALSMVVFIISLRHGIMTFDKLCENTPYNGCSDMMIRLLIYLLAFGNGIAFLRFSKATKVASIMGTMTLYIYVYHQFFVELFVKIEKKLSMPHALPIILTEAALIVLICCFISTIPLFRYATNPITNFIKRK